MTRRFLKASLQKLVQDIREVSSIRLVDESIVENSHAFMYPKNLELFFGATINGFHHKNTLQHRNRFIHRFDSYELLELMPSRYYILGLGCDDLGSVVVEFINAY